MKFLSPLEQKALEKFKKEVESQFGARLTAVKLFGSKVSGDVHEESDIDVLVLVKNLSWKEKNGVIDLATGILIETDVDISPLCITPEEFGNLRNRERRIALDIEREGIPL